MKLDMLKAVRTASVRNRLMLLTVSLLAPAFACMAVLLLNEVANSRRQFEEQLLAMTRALASTVDQQLTRGVAINETLATSESLSKKDWAGFHQQALLATDGGGGWVVLLDATGQELVNTSARYGEPLPKKPLAANVVRALSEGRTSISNLTTGARSMRKIIVVDTPVVIQGQVYDLAYIVEARSFAQIFLKQKLPKGWVAAILDADERVVARSRDNDRFTGVKATSDMRDRLQLAAETVGPSTSLDGEKMLTIFSRSPATGWTFIVALPQSQLRAAKAQSVSIAALGAIGLLIIGVLLARFFSREIVGQMHSLAGDAEQIAEGAIPCRRQGQMIEIQRVSQVLCEVALELQAREENHKLMINELNHRVKNTLTTVQSLAMQTFSKDPNQGGKLEVFTDRLVALSRAHDLLTRSSWDGADLGRLLEQSAQAYTAQIEFKGEHVRLPPRPAIAMALVAHELTVNSVKYGALSKLEGRVRVSWTLDTLRDELTLDWVETGGPMVCKPQAVGFGSRLIKTSIERELGGAAIWDFRAKGLRFHAVISTANWANQADLV